MRFSPCSDREVQWKARPIFAIRALASGNKTFHLVNIFRQHCAKQWVRYQTDIRWLACLTFKRHVHWFDSVTRAVSTQPVVTALARTRADTEFVTISHKWGRRLPCLPVTNKQMFYSHRHQVMRTVADWLSARLPAHLRYPRCIHVVAPLASR